MKFCGKHIGEDDTFRVSTVTETIKKIKKKSREPCNGSSKEIVSGRLGVSLHGRDTKVVGCAHALTHAKRAIRPTL